MAPGSNKNPAVLWKIAKNPEISQEPIWEELEFYLHELDVDTTVLKPEDWMRLFEEIRHKIESIKHPAAAERSSSIEVERQPDNTSESDSGYQSDKVCCLRSCSQSCMAV